MLPLLKLMLMASSEEMQQELMSEYITRS